MTSTEDFSDWLKLGDREQAKSPMRKVEAGK